MADGFTPSMFSFKDLSSKDFSFLDKYEYKLVKSSDDFYAMLEAIKNACAPMGFDIESSGLSFLYSKIAGFSLSLKEDAGYYLPVGHVLGNNCVVKDATFLFLNAIKDKHLCYHNSSFDWSMIYAKTGVDLNISDDTMLADVLIEFKHGCKLKDLAKKLLGREVLELDEVVGTKDFTTTDPDESYVYACQDSDVTLGIRNILSKTLVEEGLSKVYQLELDVVKPSSIMTITGVSIDVSYLNAISEFVKKQLLQIEARIFSYADSPFNINSPDQLASFLYDKLAIKSDTRSTAEPVLSKLKKSHPAIEHISKYRSLEKLRNTYIDKLPNVLADDGRLHGNFNQLGAESGRFSASGGIGKAGVKVRINLQNLAKSLEDDLKEINVEVPEGCEKFEGRSFHEHEIAERGWKIVDASVNNVP